MTEIIRVRDLKFSLDDLAKLLVRAKKETYASGREPERLPDGSKRMVFRDSGLCYIDNWYVNGNMDGGRELVKVDADDGEWIWHMGYHGGLVGEATRNPELAKKTMGLLKKALLRVSERKPFRGYEDNFTGATKISCISEDCSLGYRVKTEGDLDSFHGQEFIEGIEYPFWDLVFEHHHYGGLLIKSKIE